MGAREAASERTCEAIQKMERAMEFFLGREVPET